MATAAKRPSSISSPQLTFPTPPRVDLVKTAPTNTPASTLSPGVFTSMEAGLRIPTLPLSPVVRAGIAMEAKHNQYGGDSGFMGKEIGQLQSSADGVGYFKVYMGASIYWTSGTSAHEVHGAIRDKWASLGAERGVLGYPVTDETIAPDGIGRFNHFQGGSIYWTPATGANEVQGAIRDKWSSLGWETSFLGYPTSDEHPTPDGVGRFNHFQGGSIYWTPSTGAHEVHGAIQDKWAALGWERSFLGYPTSDEAAVTLPGIGEARVSTFERGSIIWTANLGAVPQPLHISFHASLTSGLPLGGSLDVVLNSQGDVTLSGNVHDSGFDNIDYVLTAVIVSPSGVSVGFQHSGHTEGTVAGLPFGTPNRDDNFVSPSGLNNQQVASNWNALSTGSLAWRLDAQDTLAEGAANLLGDLAQKALVALGTEAVASLVALFFV
jgi:hypothetical protein